MNTSLSRFRHCILAGLCVLSALCATPARATDVNVVGLTQGKAIVVVNNGKPRTLSIGQSSPEGVKLLSADSREAVLEIDGKRKTMKLGQHIAGSYSNDRARVSLQADMRGHFITDGSVNGRTTRFMVDTGATSVAMSSSEAKRLGIEYLKGEPITMSTANGLARAWRVSLHSVRVGSITLTQVEGVVAENDGIPITLLGMSFLNRMEIRRDGQSMTLTQRY